MYMKIGNANKLTHHWFCAVLVFLLFWFCLRKTQSSQHTKTAQTVSRVAEVKSSVQFWFCKDKNTKTVLNVCMLGIKNNHQTTIASR